MTRPVKYAAGIVMAFVVVIIGLLALSGFGSNETSPPVGQGESQLVRADSHVLGEKGASDVTFVEFLDFECEACRAAYPAVEQLRTDYAGRVTFVARYFPMPGHFNAERAARAVKAAARQGKFEAMYQRMYETQEEWGEQQVPLDDLFRSFAEDLGLDMGAYDLAYADPTVAARIDKDQQDGLALGVEGTPTFFVDGKRLEPRTYGDLTDALDAALDQPSR